MLQLNNVINELKEMKKMTAKEFLKTLNLPKNWSGEDEEHGQWLFYEKNVIEAMEQYHQSKVNSSVSDDVIKCDCKLERHERAKMELDYNKCMDCKKEIQ
tara:strand:+ start:19062 stop:19361 length:300 start_codon:yes stop_codon:yes gene_type:complete